MKPELSNQQLLQFLTEKYGSEPQRAPIAEGMESRVLTFIWGDQQYILRVNPNQSGFQKDRWCFQQFHSEELPIPEILRSAHSHPTMLIASPEDSLESHSRTVQFQLFNNSLRTLGRFGRAFTNLYCLVLRALVLLTSADTLPSHPGNPFCSQRYAGKINSGIICLPVIC